MKNIYQGKNKLLAGFLAFFLGGLGIHRFYLGQWWGIFYLLFVWTFIPSIISLVEAILFFRTNDTMWGKKYGASVLKGNNIERTNNKSYAPITNKIRRNTKRNVIIFFLIIFSSIIVYGTIRLGSSETIVWEVAKINNDLKSYNDYLKKFPDGNHLSEAKLEIASLEKSRNDLLKKCINNTIMESASFEPDSCFHQILMKVCLDSGIQEAALYIPDSCFHPILVYRLKNNSYSDYNNKIPRNWQPKALRFCELVACIEEEEKTLVQTCRYTGGGKTIDLYKYSIHVKIKSAKTAQVLDLKTFYGKGADECPITANAFSGSSIVSAHVDFYDIKEWLKQFTNLEKYNSIMKK